jgi:hypothetical protein
VLCFPREISQSSAIILLYRDKLSLISFLPVQKERRLIIHFKVEVHINRAPLIEYIGLDVKHPNMHLQLGEESEHEIFMSSKLWL